jgi:hypothetical protein
MAYLYLPEMKKMPKAITLYAIACYQYLQNTDSRLRRYKIYFSKKNCICFRLDEGENHDLPQLSSRINNPIL